MHKANVAIAKKLIGLYESEMFQILVKEELNSAMQNLTGGRIVTFIKKRTQMTK